MALAYTCFVTDFIHEGHLNIINEATKYGEVIVGVLADEEMVKYDSYPISTTEERVRRVQELEGVSKVVVQRNMMYTDIIEEYHPDFIVHGDNWCTGHLSIV
ncbi:MAG: adenylyltransferase/cytidyltransferase family protein, partial [Pseudobutyrivibrio sp.]|nr:adenylyltransferase/cytidyltransferase family protein [Pseudobutyrivibrio sp.]